MMTRVPIWRHPISVTVVAIAMILTAAAVWAEDFRSAKPSPPVPPEELSEEEYY
jgi:hypothetical protein